MRPELSVVVPFRNAGGCVRDNLERLNAYLAGLPLSYEIVAVDDGSGDGTFAALIQAAGTIGSLRVLRARRHLGKGACLGEAMRAARGDRIVALDGDLAYPLEAIPSMLKALAEADVAVVRRIGLSTAPRAWIRRRLTPLFRALARRIVPGVRDPQAGFKAFRREAAQLIASRQRCAGFGFDVEAVAVALGFGLKVAEVETTWDGSGPSTVRPLRDGAKMAAELAAIWWRLRGDVYRRSQGRWWDGLVAEVDLSDRDAVAEVERQALPLSKRLSFFIIENPAWLAVPLSSALIFLWFLPEVVHHSLYLNDGVLHASIVRRMDAAWLMGGDIFDFWLKNVAAGHAFIRVSHFLLYLFAFLIHRALFGFGSIELSFSLAVLATVVMLPFSVYLGGRLLGLSVAESAAAAAILPIIRDTGGYGISLENFTFTGHGIYNEAFAMLSFPITIGLIHRALKGERLIVPAAISYTVTWMSHFFVGYMAAVWLVVDSALLAACDRRRWAEPLGRGIGINALFGLFGAGLIVPVVQDRLLQFRSPDEPYYRFMGRGAHAVLQSLASGDFFDNARAYPAVTILALAGLALGARAIARSRRLRTDEPAPWLAAQGVLWIGLTFGRATWGRLLALLPFYKDLHWHRFIVGTQLILIYCAAVALAAACRWLRRRFPASYAMPCAGLLAAVFVPGILRGNDYFLGLNQRNLIASQRAWRQDTEFHHILDFALSHPEGRFDPGHYNNFGKDMTLAGFPLFAVLNEFNVQTMSFLYHSLGLTSPLPYYTDLIRDRGDMSLVNVRYLAVPPETPVPSYFKPVLKGPTATVYDNGDREGFFMVGSPAPARCADDEILYYSVRGWLKGQDEDNRIFAGLTLLDQCRGTDTLIDAIDTRAKPTAAGAVLSSGVEQGRESYHYFADVRMDSPGLIVFKMEYHPSWQVTLNGSPVKTYMVMPGFTAVRIASPGRYRIEAEYLSSGLRKWLLLMGGFCALLFGLWHRLRAPAGPAIQADNVRLGSHSKPAGALPKVSPS